MSTAHADISSALQLIFQGISQLQTAFPHRLFTIDGRLVGDIGEIVAALEYDMVIDPVSQKVHDGTTADGRRVQVKATFKNSLTFSTVPDYYLGLKLNKDGSFEEIFNGPGSVLYEHFQHRQDIGVKLLSFSNSKLKELSAKVPWADRIPRREATPVEASQSKSTEVA
jgi:hypothetical protein